MVGWGHSPNTNTATWHARAVCLSPHGHSWDCGEKVVCCVALTVPLPVFPGGSAPQVSEAHGSFSLSFSFLSFLFISFLSSATLLIGSHSNMLPVNMLFAYVLANVYFEWIDAYGFNLWKWYCAVYCILAFTCLFQEHNFIYRWTATECPVCGFPSRSMFYVHTAPVKDPA